VFLIRGAFARNIVPLVGQQRAVQLEAVSVGGDRWRDDDFWRCSRHSETRQSDVEYIEIRSTTGRGFGHLASSQCCTSSTFNAGGHCRRTTPTYCQWWIMLGNLAGSSDRTTTSPRLLRRPVGFLYCVTCSSTPNVCQG